MESSSSQKKKRIDILYHPAILWLFRLLVGATFVISGFSKSIDPWGSFYKISEYLDVWAWDIPSSLVVLGAFLLGGVEFVFGALLLFGCYKRFAAWILLAMMAFMLPLTLYIAIANPVADCGCFGDMLILSNTATFVKNIFLTLMLIYLCLFNRRTGGLFVAEIQWVIGGLLSLYIMLIALIGYNVQPLLDFRRFAPGTDLLAGVADAEDENDVDDGDVVYEFIYEKDGHTETFGIDNLPDSTWAFVDRKVVGGSESVADGFSVIYDGEEIAGDIIDPESDQFLVTIPDMQGVDLSYTYLLNELNDYITARGGSLVALVNGDSESIDWWRDISMASYPIYSAEPTMIKELARGRAAIVYLRHGVVVWKRALSSINYSFVTETPVGEITEDLNPETAYTLNTLTLVFVIVIFTIMILDRSGRLVAWHIRRKRKVKRPSGDDDDNDKKAPSETT
ncbi:MAG: DoxX family protein [Staphylococcus sp.]|nr:DoxX family protein [Staphylococcus sp.]